MEARGHTSESVSYSELVNARIEAVKFGLSVVQKDIEYALRNWNALRAQLGDDAFFAHADALWSEGVRLQGRLKDLGSIRSALKGQAAISGEVAA